MIGKEVDRILAENDSGDEWDAADWPHQRLSSVGVGCAVHRSRVKDDYSRH